MCTCFALNLRSGTGDVNFTGRNSLRSSTGEGSALRGVHTGGDGGVGGCGGWFVWCFLNSVSQLCLMEQSDLV